jgi:hypothetical protein
VVFFVKLRNESNTVLKISLSHTADTVEILLRPYKFFCASASEAVASATGQYQSCEVMYTNDRASGYLDRTVPSVLELDQLVLSTLRLSLEPVG